MSALKGSSWTEFEKRHKLKGADRTRKKKHSAPDPDRVEARCSWEGLLSSLQDLDREAFTLVVCDRCHRVVCPSLPVQHTNVCSSRGVPTAVEGPGGGVEGEGSGCREFPPGKQVREFPPDVHCGAWTDRDGGHCGKPQTGKEHGLSEKQEGSGRSKQPDEPLKQNQDRTKRGKPLKNAQPSVQEDPAASPDDRSVELGLLGVWPSSGDEEEGLGDGRAAHAPLQGPTFALRRTASHGVSSRYHSTLLVTAGALIGLVSTSGSPSQAELTTEHRKHLYSSLPQPSTPTNAFYRSRRPTRPSPSSPSLPRPHTSHLHTAEQDFSTDRTAEDSSVDRTAKDSTVDRTAKDSTVDRTAKDSTVDRTAKDSTVDRTAKDSTVDRTAKDSTVDRTAKDSTVDRTARDSTVDKIAQDFSVDRIAQDVFVDRTAKDVFVDRTEPFIGGGAPKSPGVSVQRRPLSQRPTSLFSLNPSTRNRGKSSSGRSPICNSHPAGSPRGSPLASCPVQLLTSPSPSPGDVGVAWLAPDPPHPPGQAKPSSNGTRTEGIPPSSSWEGGPPTSSWEEGRQSSAYPRFELAGEYPSTAAMGGGTVVLNGVHQPFSPAFYNQQQLGIRPYPVPVPLSAFQLNGQSFLMGQASPLATPHIVGAVPPTSSFLHAHSLATNHSTNSKLKDTPAANIQSPPSKKRRVSSVHKPGREEHTLTRPLSNDLPIDYPIHSMLQEHQHVT